MYLINYIRRWLEPNDDLSEGSITLSINRGLEITSFGSAHDEEIALKCNKMVRKCLDKNAISYEAYKDWRCRNPLIFTPVLSDSKDLIGFIDIFPLKIDIAASLINGEMAERDLQVDDLIPIEKIKEVKHLHIATILVNPHQKIFSPIVAKEIMLIRMGMFIRANYLVENTTFSAFGQSKSGKNLLRRCGFQVKSIASDNKQKCDLYTLSPKDSKVAIAKFLRAEENFGVIGRDEENFQKIDMRLSVIEITLRGLIIQAAEGDFSKIPNHLIPKVNERMATAKRKILSLKSMTSKK